ncbi:hypothetical protein VSDG_05896 [Cytospora chrysosperma]|uniref:Uncharacterized protein n=1 Tax=Cytospora chrysosperma TaxID=252740 RepID=A0A423VU31_CYTCH|nr:hypothetical protein VSDG_05896 [Valsa sordida]
MTPGPSRAAVAREGADAEDPRAELDWVNALLHYVRRVGAAPVLLHNRGALDLVSIRSCCESIVGHVAGGGGGGGEAVRYFNLVGDSVIPLDRLSEMDCAAGGKVYGLLPMTEWIGKAVAAGLHPAVAILIEEMDAPGNPEYPRLLKGLTSTFSSL